MAGIGFSLRKMLKEDSTYSTKVHAWFHTAIVSAGPWVISIMTINIILAFAKRWGLPYVERELLIASIIYATLFSQILTAPFQMIMTRYIADRIYSEEYDYIKPSFWGVAILISLIALFIGIRFYLTTMLPIEFVYICVALMVVLSVLWILVVYQSTLKNFKLITSSNLLGTFVTFALILYLANNPLEFSSFRGSTNLLLAYLGGIVFFTLFLLVAFLTEMKSDNGRIFHFIRYFHSVPSLWPIGLFYTLAIWVDNLIMWFSPISISLYGIYRYAPFYDVATFYAYLTILPSVMLFMVLIETDFYTKCREYYLAILNNGPLEELEIFARNMWKSLQKNILQTFEIQLFVTILVIVLSRTVFPLLGVPEESRQIFVIYALGAFCNAFILIFLQVLLYIGERNRTLGLMLLFLCTNILFTLLSLRWGEGFYGLGFFIASFITLLAGLYLTVISYKRVIRFTYMTQPVYTRGKDRPFERLEQWIDKRMNDQDSLDRLYLEKRKSRAEARISSIDDTESRKAMVALQEQKQREAEKDRALLDELFGFKEEQGVPAVQEGEPDSERPSEPAEAVLPAAEELAAEVESDKATEVPHEQEPYHGIVEDVIVVPDDTYDLKTILKAYLRENSSASEQEETRHDKSQRDNLPVNDQRIIDYKDIT